MSNIFSKHEKVYIYTVLQRTTVKNAVGYFVIADCNKKAVINTAKCLG